MKPFTVDTESKTFTPKPPPPAGSHAARLIWLVDLGTQEDQWQGETKIRRKVRPFGVTVDTVWGCKAYRMDAQSKTLISEAVSRNEAA